MFVRTIGFALLQVLHETFITLAKTYMEFSPNATSGWRNQLRRLQVMCVQRCSSTKCAGLVRGIFDDSMQWLWDAVVTSLKSIVGADADVDVDLFIAVDDSGAFISSQHFVNFLIHVREVVFAVHEVLGDSCWPPWLHKAAEKALVAVKIGLKRHWKTCVTENLNIEMFKFFQVVLTCGGLLSGQAVADVLATFNACGDGEGCMNRNWPLPHTLFQEEGGGAASEGFLFSETASRRAGTVLPFLVSTCLRGVFLLVSGKRLWFRDRDFDRLWDLVSHLVSQAMNTCDKASLLAARKVLQLHWNATCGGTIALLKGRLPKLVRDLDSALTF